MSRIVLADEHEVFRLGLKTILSNESGLQVVGEAASAYEAMQLVRAGGVDILVMELLSNGGGGIDLIRQSRQSCAALRPFVLTGYREAHLAQRAMQAGACGYFTKANSAGRIVEAMHNVATGRTCVSEDIAEQLMEQLRDGHLPGSHACLTRREFEIFLRIASGENSRIIADALSLSAKTVSSHKARIMNKMKLTSMSELVQYAVAHRLLAEYIV